MKKALLGLGFILLVCVGGSVYLQYPESWEPADSSLATWLAAGPYSVAEVDFQVVDESRPTVAHDDFEGSPAREINGLVWMPENKNTPAPLLLYSHGFMSDKTEGRYLAEFLASYGYIVVAFDFPATHLFAPGGPNVLDVENQPGDISFVLDSFLAWNSDPSSDYFQRIDHDRIAAAGVSLGGLTTELLAFHPKTRDPRIRAAISIAGPASMFTERFFAGSTLPFMMVAATTDAMVRFSSNAEPLLEKYPHTTLVAINQGTHTGFADIAARLFRFMDNVDEVGCSALTSVLSRESPDDFMKELLGEEYGVVFSDRDTPCSWGLPEKALSPAQQQAVTRLAVKWFLDSQFADSAEQRSAAYHQLVDELELKVPKLVDVRRPNSP